MPFRLLTRPPFTRYPLSTGKVTDLQAAYKATILGMSPILYFPMDETSGTAIVDASVNGDNGVYTGVTLGNPGPISGGLCPYFDGSSDYGTISGAALTSFAGNFSPTAGTAACWVRLTDWTITGTAKRIFTINVNTENLVRAYKNTAANSLAYQYGAGATYETVSVGSGVTGWAHVCITWNKAADQVIAYLNGSQTGATQTGLGVWSGTVANVFIGADTATPTLPVDGYIAHFAVWDRTLTPTEVGTIGNP